MHYHRPVPGTSCAQCIVGGPNNLIYWRPQVANIPNADAPSHFEQAAQAVMRPAVAGRKDDGGKLPWSLLMRGLSLSLEQVVLVLQFGAKKYAEDSWQEVPGGYERYKDALYRHLSVIEQRGPLARDPETGLLEWAHVGCNALFLTWYAIKGKN